MLKVCNKCLYEKSHPFGLSIYDKGCSGCDTHHEKYSINWAAKRDELENEIKLVKAKSKGYDCVVPVVGDAEDYYVVSKVLELGLNPLIVSVNDYFKNDIGWHNLHNLITHFDVDSFVFNPNINVYKDLVRTSLRKFDHILLPFLSLHTSFPVHVAKARKIPLIIWGQNQAVEQVGKFSHYDKVEMSKWGRKEHDLFNCDIDTLIGNGAQVDERDLNYYQYPNIDQLSSSGVKGVYLSNYFHWDPLYQNSNMTDFGFKPQKNTSSFDIYERTGSSVYYELHDLMKLKRTGYRKIRDHLVREIRHGRITREEATKLESIYNQSKVDISGFCRWLDVSDSGVKWLKLHKFKGLENIIGTQTECADIKVPEAISLLLKPSSNVENKFVTFGKGVHI